MLNDFKQNLKTELKGLILGLNSYDYTKFSTIRIFLNADKLKEVNEILENKGYSLTIEQKNGLKHNADYLIKFNYFYGE